MVLLVLLSSCYREKDGCFKWGVDCCSNTDKDTVYMSSKDLQNCKYKTGTYWVFIDSVANIFDSVAIVDFHQGFNNPRCSKFVFEVHSFKTQSFYSSKSIDYLVCNSGVFKNRTEIPNTRTDVFAVSLIYQDFVQAFSTTNCVIERLDSMFVFNQFYKKILRVEIEKDHTEDNNKSVYFMNSEFGFLRHDVYDNSVLISQKLLMRKRIVR